MYQNSSALFPDARIATTAVLALREKVTETVPSSSGKDMTDEIFSAEAKEEIGKI